MLVETFECTETAEETSETTSEALALIEELGLSGQSELSGKKKSGGDARSPYRQITAEEMFVYRTLCPVATPIQKYSASPIPLRVLQIAAHAKSLGIFKHIKVWDRESVAIKDPVLVADDSDYDWSTPTKTFILARWGDELEAFAVLLQRAIELKRKQLVSEAESTLSSVKSATDAQIVKWGFGANVVVPT